MVKAKKADSPRVLKTWRIRKDILKLIEVIAKKEGLAPSEILERSMQSTYWYHFKQMK